MSKTNLNKYKKQILVSSLFLFALALLMYSLFGGNQPTTTKQTLPQKHSDRIPAIDLEKQISVPTKISTSPQPAPIITGDTILEQFTSFDVHPNKPKSKTQNTVRNLFIYPPPPPPPPVPPAPPPPIILQSVAPTSVYARTDKQIELIVRGGPFNESSKIFFDNIQLNSRLTEPVELRATLTPNMFNSAKNVSIIVKDSINPTKLFSNTMSFQTLEPPSPSAVAKYVGWVSEKGGKNPGAILAVSGSNGERHQILHEGGIFNGRFKITKITQTLMHIEDTQLSGVRHSLQLEGATGTPGNSNSFSTQPMGSTSPSYPQYQQYTQYEQTTMPKQSQEIIRSKGPITIRDGEGRILNQEEIQRRQLESTKQMYEKTIKDLKKKQ